MQGPGRHRWWGVSTSGWFPAGGFLYRLLVVLMLSLGTLLGRRATTGRVSFTGWAALIPGVGRKVCIVHSWCDKPLGRVVIGKCVEG